MVRDLTEENPPQAAPSDAYRGVEEAAGIHPVWRCSFLVFFTISIATTNASSLKDHLARNGQGVRLPAGQTTTLEEGLPIFEGHTNTLHHPCRLRG